MILVVDGEGRLEGALKNHVNYFGTDPNYLLTDRLKQLSKDYKETTNTNTLVDIRTQGSEIFIPEWENKIGVAFSSPPYFYLEDYKIGNQSYKEGMNYEDWKNNYLKPTFENIYKYLINEGYFILNINNFKDFKLVEDSIEIAEKVGFNFIKYHKLNNIKRVNSNSGFNDNSEKILVFTKNNICEKEEGEYDMDFFGKIKDISLQGEEVNITLSTYNQTILEALEKIKKNNKDIVATIKRRSKKRSLDSNALAWHLCEEIAKVINSDKDSVYLKMLERYGVFSHVVVKPNIVEKIEEQYKIVRNLGEVKINSTTGIQLQIFFGSSTYDQIEMNRFINGIVSECREMGIPTPEDEEVESLVKEWNV